MLTNGAGQRRADRRREGDRRARLVRGAPVRAPRTSTRSTPRASADPTTCAASRTTPARSCRTRWRPPGRRTERLLRPTHRTMTAPIAALVPNADIPGVAQLAELALDLRSTWNHSADELWGQLDPELWALTHSPWVVLQTVARTRLAGSAARAHVPPATRIAGRGTPDLPDLPRLVPAASPGRAARLRRLLQHGVRAQRGAAHLLGRARERRRRPAEDRAATSACRWSAIGLLYQQGYFRQVIEPDGAQRALYPYNAPVVPAGHAGARSRRRVAAPGGGRPTAARSCCARGRRRSAARRSTCSTATIPPTVPPTAASPASSTAADRQLRLTQEIALGIGGWRLLRRLGLRPDVCHLNEGHAAFAVLERARGFMEDTGQPFDVALAVTRAGNVFTTHTPVAAGFDRFDAEADRAHAGRLRAQGARHLRRPAAGARPRAAARSPPSPSTWRTSPSAAAWPSTASAGCTGR